MKKATAALVLGILSLIFWFLPIFGLPISIVGLVMGLKGYKKGHKYALAAVILCVIGLCLSVANAALGVYLGVTGQHALFN